MTTATSITVRVPLAIRRRPGRKTIVTPMATGPAEATTRADPALVKALARAFRYQRMLDNGVYGSVTEMAAAENIGSVRGGGGNSDFDRGVGLGWPSDLAARVEL
ncbi:MAG: hypothetical protein O9325_05330 [Roseomonas sp.]|nr:hypothetical protein [Roseomonas sp.]